MASRLRIVAAALTAPLIGVLVAYALVVVLLDLSEDLEPRELLRFFRNFMMIGGAVAYAVEAMVGIPAAVLQRRRDRITFLSTLGVGALGGVIAFLPVLRVMTQDTSALAGTSLLGAASGGCAGAWFWVVGLRRPRPKDPEGSSHEEASPPEAASEPSAP